MKTAKNQYWFSLDDLTEYGVVSTGEVFMFDADDFSKMKDIHWYRCKRGGDGFNCIRDHPEKCIHRVILTAPKGYETDHINFNPLDNRKSNLRICTHQQNQCNQTLQKNNTSGVSGVSYYPPRNKYRARIKYFQQEIHLGYYNTIREAVEERNEGMHNLFGDY